MAKNHENKFGNNNHSEKKNDGPKKDPKIVSIDSLKEQYAAEMVSTIGPKSLLQFTKITADVLEDEFEKNCDINRREIDGNYRLYVTQKGVEKKSEGQLLVTVRKDHTYNIRLNPYNSYDKHYFLAEGLDTKQLIKEIPTIKGFFANQQVPAQSVFKKESYGKESYPKAA